MLGQCSSSLGIAKLFAGEENLLRISPSTTKGRFTLDGIREISCLKGLGMSEARKALPKLRKMFLTNPVSPFEPYYSPTRACMQSTVIS